MQKKDYIKLLQKYLLYTESILGQTSRLPASKRE